MSSSRRRSAMLSNHLGARHLGQCPESARLAHSHAPGEGRLTEPTPAARSWPRKRVFMPHTCRLRYPPGSAQLGGNRSFADTRRGNRIAPISRPSHPYLGTGRFDTLQPFPAARIRVSTAARASRPPEPEVTDRARIRGAVGIGGPHSA